MRKIALFSHHSQGNAALAELTLLNHWRYSLRWGYDFIVYREPWPQAKEWVMNGGELAAMANHEVFVSVGADVVFTNFAKPIHEFADPNYGLVITTEHWAEPKGRNFINCGVAIYHNNAKFGWFTDRMQQDCAYYLHAPLWCQELMADLLGINGETPVTVPYAKEVIKVIPARSMNSHVHGTAGAEGIWQPGDLVAHCFAMTEEDKLTFVKRYLEKVEE